MVMPKVEDKLPMPEEDTSSKVVPPAVVGELLDVEAPMEETPVEAVVAPETVEETYVPMEEVSEYEETEEYVEPVVEPTPVYYDDGLTEEERAERRALKNKWIRMADPEASVAPKSEPIAPVADPMMPVPKVEVPEDGIDDLKSKWMRFADVNLDVDEFVRKPEFIEEQVVNCPGCGRKLSVKFGTDVAKCPACSAMFVLKKVAKEVPIAPMSEPAVEEFDDGLTVEERYLREAEEELRRMIEEA